LKKKLCPEEKPMLPEMYDKEPAIAPLAGKVLADNALLSEILEGLTSKDETLRYNCHKVLLSISETNGDRLYPEWDYFANFLEDANSYRKMSAVHIIARLTKVDKENRFEKIMDKYYNLLDDKSMIVAVYIAAVSGDIVRAKPGLERAITGKLLDIDKTHHTEERKPLIKGGAIESFDKYFPEAAEKERIIEFVQGALECDSPKTRKLARSFLKKWEHPHND
jgi:hypothetical protein